MLPINSNIYLIIKFKFGDYYCIDNVGVLHDALKSQFAYLGNNFEYYFGLLYSLYSLPNIILPFIGGLLVMKYGIRKMYMVFGGFIMIGQLVFALGCQHSSIGVMLLGRIIFGFGGECLNICQNAMIVKWFYKSEIALPLGLTISVSRLGSVLNDVASPRLIQHEVIFNYNNS
jgi:MFS family permease